MNKKAFLSVLVVILFLGIIFISNKKDINDILDQSEIKSLNYIEITHKNNISDVDNPKVVLKNKDIDNVLDFLSTYKYKEVTIKNYKDLDNKESYILIGYDSDNNEVLRLCTRGDLYISVYNKENEFKTYKVVKEHLDLNYLKNLYSK